MGVDGEIRLWNPEMDSDFPGGNAYSAMRAVITVHIDLYRARAGVLDRCHALGIGYGEVGEWPLASRKFQDDALGLGGLTGSA